MPSRFVLRMLIIAMALALTAFASSSPASNGQPGPGSDNPAIHTVLQPDLTLHSTLSRSLLPQDTNNDRKPTSGFCLGACTVRCASNADCGPGGFCRPFVICMKDRKNRME